MTNVCLCLKIHIPAIQLPYKFRDTGHNHRYFDELATETYVRQVYVKNIVPFYKALSNAGFQSRKKIKFGLSISGVALALLQKHVPEAIVLLRQLEKKNDIEILSEPWSHSITPFFNMRTLTEQVQHHDKTVQSIFGKTPEVFIVHSPEYLSNFRQTIQALNKKAIFTNFNPIDSNSQKQLVSENSEDIYHPLVLPINYKLSGALQEIDSYPFEYSPQSYKIRFINKLKQFEKTDKSMVLVYNVTLANTKFLFSRSILFKQLIALMSNDLSLNFQSPSEYFNTNKYERNQHIQAPETHTAAKLSNRWMKNSYQDKIFQLMLRINTLMLFETNRELINQWNLLQDMENLHYMNDRFNDKNYASFHFNPYYLPENAFRNFSNILYDFLNRLENKIVQKKNDELYIIGKHVFPEKEQESQNGGIT